MKLIGKVSQYERIVAFIDDPNADMIEFSGLSEHDKTVCKRWLEAFTMLRDYKSVSDAAAILMKRFPGLSKPTAYRDCTNAMNMFGNITTAKKDAIKHLSTEIVKDAINIARLKNNEDGMIKGALAIARINGVNTTDPDLPDFAQLEPHTYEISLPPTLINVLMQMVAKNGKIDLTQVVNNMSNFAIDADIVEDDN